ncbi:MAG: two-component system, sensor histidine kinase PdtaS [Chloroflexota bacterium]|jgi:two-component sensor histidine kinase/PAS domain-containing protein|nr:two-component system, sensor histidine kinase PdtaS [Chloroflexota bacterium]
MAQIQPSHLTRAGNGPDGPAIDLDPMASQQLESVFAALPVIADVCHADLLVYMTVEGITTVVAHARPNPVPSLYPGSLVGSVLPYSSSNPVHRVLAQRRDHASLSGTLVWGAPTVQDVFPISVPDTGMVAVVGVHTNLLEHERLQRRDPLYRGMVAKVRSQGFAGQLVGASSIGRLTEHDGVLIVDTQGIILYTNSIAENQYRRLGYVDTIVGGQISFLETNEYSCFRSIERSVCLEQRIQELDQVWIKRAVPLLPSAHAPRHFPIWRGSDHVDDPEGAVLFIQDITDEVRREQELKIKSAMIQEVHHRVKNNLQTLAFLLRMEAKRATSEDAQNALRQTIGRVLSIAVVHEFLSRGEMSDISIRDVCSRIISETSGGMIDTGTQVEIRVDGENFSLPAQQATSCALVMNEVILNAIEHGFAARASGSINVQFSATDASMVIDISDDGVGLPAGFDLERNSSLGLQIVRTLVQDDLHGRFQLLSGDGVTARISFPKELCRPA